MLQTNSGPAPINVLVGNPQANGLPSAETRVDYQDITGYVEALLTERLSTFVELPVRFLNPQEDDNTVGLADMNAGFKWAFLYGANQVGTFQLRTYIPTGAASRGLGTNHVSLEPALLYFLRLSDRLSLQGEFRDWIPVGGTDFEGNVLRYGLGLNYTVINRPSWALTPVIEVVGWTVLNGKETAPLGNNVFAIENAGGTEIVNAKFGARLRMGQSSDLYVGYGRALTGAVWYKDIVRVEFRYFF
jgi:hypothetical protein